MVFNLDLDPKFQPASAFGSERPSAMFQKAEISNAGAARFTYRVWSILTVTHGGYPEGVNRNDPAERIWNALKQLARSEKGVISSSEAIRRVKAVAKKEGALGMPDGAVRFYADEYRAMVRDNKKSG
jgi:hypothetical protein